MGRTPQQIKKSLGITNGLRRRETQEPRKLTPEEIKSNIKAGKYNLSLVKKNLESTIGFDTFQSDLSSVGKTIEDSYKGWQSSDALEQNLDSIKSMQDRVSAYKEYFRLFGEGSVSDIDELQSSLRNARRGWDDLKEEYGKFDSADTYNGAIKEYEGLKTADIGALGTEITDLEKIYSVAKEYDDKVLEFSKKSINLRNPSAIKPFEETLKKLTNDRDSYLKSVGYSNLDELEKALGEKKVYKTKAERTQNFIKLSSVGDVNSENYDKDFEEKSKYVAPKQKKFGISIGSSITDEDIHQYINDEDFRQKYLANATGSADSSIALVGYDNMTDQERKLYNYYYNEYGVETAKEYLEGIKETIGARKAEDLFARIKGDTFSELSFGVWAGLDQFTTGISNNFSNKDYIPTNAIQQTSAMVREDLSSNHGNWGTVPYDLITTGANQLPSILVSTGLNAITGGVGGTVGKVLSGVSKGAGLATMGVSARGNAYQEMLNLGYDKDQANTYANLVGASEMGLQAVIGGISKLGGTSAKISKVVKGIDNGFARFAIQYGGSIASEGAEEGLQEILTPMFKNIAAGYDTGAEIDWGEVAYSTLLGALMGGAFEGPGLAINSIAEHSQNKALGRNIKANERIGDVFDLANNPEIAEAYETYTRYANKGITADNVSDVKLGRLYSTAKKDTVDILTSKKSTSEQKENALKRLAEMSVIETENVVAKEKKNLNIGEETTVTESGETVDIKDLKVKGEDIVVATDNGEVSIADMTFKDKDAELVALARIIAREDGEDVANLFINQYDGESNVEAYANSFNLTMAYAKNNFTFNEILNKKGNLSGEQVSAIYRETRIKADKEKAEHIKKLNKEMADKGFYKGIIDESVIDYNNTSAEGKVNWKDLTDRQRKAVTFIKGFAQATGMNLTFVANNSKYNGRYDRTSNMMYINLDEGGFDAISNIQETLIPTMSHETTHWMKEKSPDLWRNLNEIVFSTLTEHYNSNTEQAIKDKIALLDKLEPYAEHTEEDARGRTITEEDLIRAEINRKGKSADVSREEIVARACEDMLKMSEQGKKIFFSLSEEEQKTLVGKIKSLINDLLNWVNELLNSYEATSTEARIMRDYKEQLQKASKVWDEMLKKSVVANQSLEKSGAFEHNEVTSIGSRDMSDFAKAVDENGDSLFQYKAIVEDKDIYREMLLKHQDIIGISNKQINELFTTIDKAVDIISENLDALDYAWDVNIDERAFSPVKPNSDSLYKVSLDFSTLCRKRLLQQTIQQTLQSALEKNLSTEESIAIRDELMKIQEEGRKIEVACALCYVESARMKSPKQINKFLNTREAVIREFFATRSGGSIKEKIANAEMKARKKLQKDNPDGLVGKNGVILDALTAPKSHMLKADADYIREEGKKAKASYQLTKHEQAELDAAIKMGVDDFTSAKGLENLAKNHPDIFDAYTSFVRNATHSKGIENDTWWRAGDSDAIGDALIEQMNAENGLRSQSWSDFQVIHLLDYIAATIELSTKGAKRQSYTKVPDYVKLLGNTGDMINMSLIPERVFNGKLTYDGVEGMSYDIAKQLRDEYHATVGTICIGINNEQIKMLLEDATIDMVIPYHHSSMSKATRKLMHIPAWESYQNFQGEKKLSDADAKAQAKKYGVEINKDKNYQKAPKFSEWFNLAEARQIAKMENDNPSNPEAYKKYGKMYGGYMAMQKAAERYLKLCAERGLAPKFSNEKADFTQDANYWKLLIDRKMVDNITGEIIEQKAIKPIFSEKSILEILNDELARYPQVKADQEYATRKVTQKFLSGDMKMDASTLEAIKKPIDNVTKVNILESSKDVDVLNSSKDTEYLELAKNPKQNEARLRQLVDEAAGERKYKKAGFHGTLSGGFTVFDKSFAKVGGNSGAGFYFSNNLLDSTENYSDVEGADNYFKASELAEHIMDTGEWNGRHIEDYDEALEIAKKEITKNPTVYSVYLKMEYPYIRDWKNSTNLYEDFYEDFDESNYSVEDYDSEDDFYEDMFIMRSEHIYGRVHDILVNAFDNIASRYDYFSGTYSDIEGLVSQIGEMLMDYENLTWDDIKGFVGNLYLDISNDDWVNSADATTEVTRTIIEELGYDSIIDKEVGKKFNQLKSMDATDTEHYIVFDSEQIKSADLVTYDDKGNIIPLSERFNKENNDIRYSEKDYSYDALVSKPDMKLAVLDSNIPNNRADIIYEAKKNAAKIGNFNIEDKTVSVFVDDIGKNIVINSDGLRHGMARGKNIQNRPIAIVTLKAGEIIKNSIRINELTPSKESATGSYILIGAGIDSDSNLYIVRSVVNEYNNKLASMDVLYAINTKKESAMLNASRYAKNPLSVTDSTISIMELLDYVNKYFPEILPESVLKHYGYYARPNSRVGDNLGESVLYSEKEQGIYDIVGEEERIRKENESLDADAKKLKDIFGTEEIPSRKYVSLANYLKKISGSNIETAKLGRMLKTTYETLQNEDSLSWSFIASKTHSIAKSILSKDLDVPTEYFKRVMHEIRKDKISLSEEQRAWAENQFGGYGNFHKSVFGRANITKDGTPLEEAWKSWAKKYPSLFDADLTGAEQIEALVELVDALKQTSAIMEEYEYEEAIRHMSTEIYNQFWNIATDSSPVDNAESYRKEHKALMETLRKDYEQRQKDLAVHPVGETALKYEALLKKVKDSKKKEIAKAKQYGREMLEGYKERAERKTAIQSITANSLSLNEMLMKNSKDKHIPEIMREPVTALLQAIDFSSKRLLEKGEPTQKDISLSKSLGKVKDMMVKATNAHEELVELYGHGLDEDIEKMVDSVDNIMRTVGDNEFVINRMSLADLQTLDKMVKTIRHAVNKLNKFHTVNHAKGIASLSQESVSYLDSLGKGKIYDGKRGTMKKLLDWGNALPYYAFKRFGSGGMKVYEALQDGWDKFAFNVKRILDYSKETYTNDEVKEWSKDIKTFKVLVPMTEYELADENYTPKYQEVQLTVPQIMAMYCLNKREQARGHLFKGGIRVADFKDAKGKIVTQSEGIIFTEKDIATILNSLTGRQKEVADKLQRFMNEDCTEWGNEVSMARFGYKAFGEENYFPIQSDKNNLAVNDETEQVNSLFKLLNMSFTKSTVEKANNRIVISDIFDVFAQHTSDMAKYNALALPVLDSFKWYNYTEKQDIAEGTFKTKGVKQSIENAFGKDGQSYFTTFLKDINGQQAVSRDTLGSGFFKNAKIASVGMNLRVVLLQPTSYVRASAIIDNKYLTKALAHKPKIAKAEEHCGIALWKSMGYYDTNIQKGVEAQIKHDETTKDKIVEWTMKGAEIADKITWGYLWNACELEIRETRTDLKVGSKEFYDTIAKRLREVIYATQVVDSTMTRSQMMRSADGMDKVLTAFASEPTLSYNMVQDAYMQYSLDARRIGKKEAIAKNGKRIARVLTAYTMTNAVAALVESMFDAFRDDDDEEKDLLTFMRKYYLSNFLSDMSITAKIPYIKEVHSLLQGFSSSRTDTQWMENFTKALTTWYKLATQDKGKASTGIKYTIKALSDLLGIPFYNVYRDTMAALNKLDLFTEEDLNEMFGDF